MYYSKRKLFIISILICIAIAIGFIYGMPNSLNTNGNNLANTNEMSGSSVSDLKFTLINDGQAYKVGAANKTLLEAKIPSQYNGLPVIEIADNAFMSCSSLTRVLVPSSIKKISNNAFINCKNLERVIGMAGVTNYGNNVFKMCPKLEKLMLPEKISSLGSSVIENVENPVYARASAEKMSSLNSNWNKNFKGNIIYGNEILYEEYTNSAGVSGYQIAPWQVLGASDIPLTIYSWCYFDENDTVGKPLLNIGEFAFLGFNVPSITLKHPEGSNLNHLINLEGYAFSGVETNRINIETDITLINKETIEQADDQESISSEGVFYDSRIQSVTLPNCLDTITPYMFGLCNNLIEIKNNDINIEVNHLSNKILTIGMNAFEDCYSIPNLYIHKDIKTICDNAFLNWGGNPDSNKIRQNIFIDTASASESWGKLWDNGYNSEKCNIEFTGIKDYVLVFEVDQEGVVDSIGKDVKIVMPKSKLNDILDITIPSSKSHEFTGKWYTTKERIAGTEITYDTEINKNLTLYAGWKVKHFDLTFIENKYLNFYNSINNSNITGDTFNFSYGETFQFYVVLKDGYENAIINLGTQEIQANTGSIYTVTILDDSKFNINADLITYKITYENLRSGTNPASNPSTYTIETPTINFENPIWDAYSGRTWDYPVITQGTYGDKSIKAIWTNPVTFSITYSNLRDGINHINNPKTYTIESPDIKFESPIWEAYAGSSWDINMIPSGSWGTKNITAQWFNPVSFEITYENLRGGKNPVENPLTYTIESPNITFLNPVWEAYSNATWDITGIPSGSWGNKIITVQWLNPVSYNIEYTGLEGATNLNPYNYTVENHIVLNNLSRTGYNFNGWYNESNERVYEIQSGTTGDLYLNAKWIAKSYTIYLDLCDGTGNVIKIDNVVYGEIMPMFMDNAPVRVGYSFAGAYSSKAFSGIKYYYTDGIFLKEKDNHYYENLKSDYVWNEDKGGITLFAKWTPNKVSIIVEYMCPGPNSNPKDTYNIKTGEVLNLAAPDIKGFTFKEWLVLEYNPGNPDNNWNIGRDSYVTTDKNVTKVMEVFLDYGYYSSRYQFAAQYEESACIAEGTLITLADGRQKAVDELTGNEQLLVWNLNTGAFDVAPILFIDSDPTREYEVIDLSFSDGTNVKVISEHGFWDFNLNKYVFLRSDAAKYIGHWFNKQTTDSADNLKYTKVQLTNVKIQKEITTAWSPVTYGHLCYYVNGMLSMPGATSGLINIFDVNPLTMRYDEDSMQADIEKYGLYNYEEFNALYPLPEAIYEAFNCKYFKIAMGKELLDEITLKNLIERYTEFFN